MKKAVVVMVILAIVLGIVYSVLALLAFIGSPLSLQEKLNDHKFETSFVLRNDSPQSIFVKNFELTANSSIELRSLGNTLFVRWIGNIKKDGQDIEPQSQLKLENSIYGKYSININATPWSELITSPISQGSCSQYAIEWFNSMPTHGLFLTIRDEDEGNFYQNMHYSISQNSSVLEIELEENFRRYSSRGSNFYYRYHCQTTGQHDRLSSFIRIIDSLTR